MTRLLFLLAVCGLFAGCTGPEYSYVRSGTPTMKLEFRRASVKPVDNWSAMEAPGPETLYVCPTVEITNEDLVSSGVRQEGGGFLIVLRLNADAAKRFGKLSESMVGVDGIYPERLAVIVDGKIIVAPSVTAPMHDGLIPVSGPWLKKEAEHIAQGLVSAVSDNAIGQKSK
jgi:preprotein translocase subunit SecD